MSIVNRKHLNKTDLTGDFDERLSAKPVRAKNQTIFLIDHKRDLQPFLNTKTIQTIK